MQPHSLSAEALAALRRGDKLEAIRSVRAELGVGLKEAKEAVDAYVDGHPELASELAAARRESNGRALWWIAAIAAFVALAWIVHAKIGFR